MLYRVYNFSIDSACRNDDRFLLSFQAVNNRVRAW